MLSEYEHQRQENIRRNQEILASLNIPKLANKNNTITKKKKVTPVVKREDVFVPVRKSTRIIEKLTGVKSPKVEEQVEEVVVKKERRVAPKMHLPYEPRLTVDDDLKDFLSTTSISLGSCGYTNVQFQNEHCLVKVSPDRIYSMAMLPLEHQVVAVAGTKFGSLVLWDATDIYSSRNVTALPKVWNFMPHPEHSISNIRISEGGIYTSSYDGSIKRLNKQFDFETMFDPSKKKDEWIICGMDVRSPNEFVISDVEGRVGLLDWREKGALVKEWKLSEKKIGCVSVSTNEYFALSSNDGRVCIHDWRMVQEKVKEYQYGRAVTSVYFHPASSDYLLSTCYDDHLRIHDTRQDKVTEVRHNNQTGRWITPFKAVWDPKSSAKESRIIIGDMNRGLDVYNEKGVLLQNVTSEYVTAQPAVSAVHPYHPVIISGNASGKLIMYSE